MVVDVGSIKLLGYKEHKLKTFGKYLIFKIKLQVLQGQLYVLFFVFECSKLVQCIVS